MKSTKFKTLGVCIATLAFLLMAVGSSSSGSNSSSSNSTTTTGSIQQDIPETSIQRNVQETTIDNASNDSTALPASDTVKLYFDIEFIPNLVFSTYDIEVYVDDLKIGTIPHGKHFTYLMDIEKGKHTVKFYKDSDNDVSSSKNIDINNDSTFQCSLHSYASDISIDDYKFEKDVTGASLTMIDVVGNTLDIAKKKLKDVGFINIKSESDNGKIIVLESNWTVVSQSIEASTVADKNIEIVLTCHKDEDSATTTETTADTTVPAETTSSISEGSKDVGFYDISLLNAKSQNEIKTKMETYLKTMFALLTNIANNDGLENAVVEINDWTQIDIFKKFPSSPQFTARIIPLYEDKSCYGFLIETPKANDFTEYMVKLKDQGFGTGFTSTNWVSLHDLDAGLEIQYIQYAVNNNTYVFVRMGVDDNVSVDVSGASVEAVSTTTAASTTATTTTTTVTTTTAETTKSAGSVSYSTNDKNTVKDGDKGLYSYKNSGDMYYIIDFDEGYVYSFSKLDSTCDRVKIISGNLNDCVFVKYTDGGSSWRQGFYFKWKRQPDHLIVLEDNGAEYDFYTTNLNDALKMKNERTIKDY